ncbi:MAG TPA: NAD(+) synthase [Bacteriovoracaceae bacterium]|nr:NAD(+) synthase [Bacteriovoracaceae bacterium]
MKTTIHLHQTHHTLADFDAIFESAVEVLKGDGLHLFPELFLTGYPLQDLVLQRPFMDSYVEHLNDLDLWARKIPVASWRALMGGLHYEFETSGLVKRIQNVIFEVIPGQGVKRLYTKRLLPNYDIFDEQKYFSPGSSNAFYEFNGELFGLQICEDMWASSFHQMDPCELMLQETKAKGYKLNGIINLSASPFDIAKKKKRMERAVNISLLFKCPFIYINRVGGEDEILFDGGSFVVAGSQIALELKTFESESRSLELNHLDSDYGRAPEFKQENTWEGLFSPSIDTSTVPAKLRYFGDAECSEVLKALQFGFQEYATKSGFSKFLVALSGGMDSALVLAIIKLSLKPGQSLEAIYMPSIHSASISTELSEKMCNGLGVRLSHLPIKFLHSTVKNAFTQTFIEPFQGLTDENVQSRLRGMLLYTRSNQTGAMVINTSNKSELAVGYSTQYGDSVGAISLLGDLYKTEVYLLAAYINRKFGSPIPAGIIDRGPSAELRENQLDQDSLPPYERLDPILEGLLSYRLGKYQLCELGFSEAEVTKVLHLYLKTEYKRIQFCPILKVKAKSFGFGYRIPLSKSLSYQLHS